jgi:hypothetical protein
MRGVWTDMRWLRDLWNWLRTGPVDQASAEKLPLEVDSLETRFRTVDKDSLKTEKEKAIYEGISKLFEARTIQKKELTWEQRYRVESEIGCLRSGDRLRQEIASRLRLAKEDRIRQADDLEKAYSDLFNPAEPSKPSDEVLRDFLLEVMETIHAHRRRKYIVVKLQAQATRNTLFLIFLVLLAAFVFVVLNAKINVKTDVASFSNVPFIPIALFGNSGFWYHFALYTAVTFGLLGALFSRLLTMLKTRSVAVLDELYIAASFQYILLRGTIGILGALVIYFFLQSGLVEGSVFPKFDQLGMKVISPGGSAWPMKLLLPSGSLALLIVWSFIAGFSESLVPTILENIERQFGGAINSPP